MAVTLGDCTKSEQFDEVSPQFFLSAFCHLLCAPVTSKIDWANCKYLYFNQNNMICLDLYLLL